MIYAYIEFEAKKETFQFMAKNNFIYFNFEFVCFPCFYQRNVRKKTGFFKKCKYNVKNEL